MNYDEACGVLELEESWNIEDLKTKYRKLALIYHPDKNKEQESADCFLRIKEAYEYLLKDMTDDSVLDMDVDVGETGYKGPEYQSMLFSFLSPILRSDMFQEIKTKVFHVIVGHLVSKCEDKALDMLKKLDKKAFAKVYKLLLDNKDILHLSTELLTRVETTFTEKIQNDECVILNPFLEDLFENNVYKLNENGTVYLVPLWHHELVYDKNGADLYVKCVPLLPENVEIDDKNNIHVKVRVSVEEAWSKDEIEIDLGSRKFSIVRRNLKFTESQVVLLANSGISRVNTDDIYNITKKGDIYVYVELYHHFIEIT